MLGNTSELLGRRRAGIDLRILLEIAGQSCAPPGIWDLYLQTLECKK